MNDKFRKLFDTLVYEISKDNGNNSNLSTIIDEIINYINKVMSKSFKINHVTEAELYKTGQKAFMYATNDVINYSTEMIRNIQNQLKNTKTTNYNPDYNDITYAMFLIDSIAHELCHCNQYLDDINGIMTEQTYLNSLCFALSDYEKIEYFDNSYEGDAYGNGVALMRSLCGEGTLKQSNYIETYKKQMAGWNFFKKNSLVHEAIYYLDKIPFMRTKRGFNDIIIYANHNIPLLAKKGINDLIKKYPLIIIGLEEDNNNCRMKNYYELMDQYFKNCITYGKHTRNLNEEEKLTLCDIYIYLLMPQLNVDKYNELCIKYGENQMDLFMTTLKNQINRKITLYNAAYQNALTRIKQIRATDKNILQNIDEKYAENKYNAAMIYLKEYSKKIDEFMGKQQKFGK